MLRDNIRANFVALRNNMETNLTLRLRGATKESYDALKIYICLRVYVLSRDAAGLMR